MIKYLTVTIPYTLSKELLIKRLQESLDSKAKEGYRLVKYEFVDYLKALVIVYEKEIEE